MSRHLAHAVEHDHVVGKPGPWTERNGCAQSRFCPESPTPPELEDVARPAACRTAPSWSARSRSGYARTDREIVSRAPTAAAPPGQGAAWCSAMKSLGTCGRRRPPDAARSRPAIIVVGIVRRPDPQFRVPACAAGEWDMCRNGRYTERGIKERHGYGAERFRVEPEFVVKVDPALGILGVLLEPAEHPGQGVGSHRAHRPARPGVGAAERCWSPGRARSASSPL